MKFIKLLKYVESSFEGKPSFLMRMSDGKEYISNGCVFTENTEENREMLIEEHYCGEYLDELLNSGDAELSEITNAEFMFHGCTSLTEFNSELPQVTYALCMFSECSSLKECNVELPEVTDARCMFDGCSSLTEFNSELPKVTNAEFMFDGCSILNSNKTPL